MDGRDDFEKAEKLLELINCSWKSQAVFVAAQLGIAELLANGPRTCAELAEATASHAPALLRLLRSLATIEICVDHGDGSFAITPLGRLLASDSPGSLRFWAMWWGGHLWPVWGKLLYSVRTGMSARTLLLQTEGFQHLDRDPEAATIFHRALIELTRLAASRIVEACDFSGVRRIVDVGGGSGELLAAILRNNPQLSGALFDLRHAVEHGRRHLEKSGLASRCECVVGDFFQSVPEGGDCYILKSVLHDWNDDRCRALLRNCRAALGNSARLLIIEEMLPNHLDNSPAHQAIARSDLTMLAALAGQERTEPELRTLLSSVGLGVTRILPTRSTFSIIEAAAGS